MAQRWGLCNILLKRGDLTLDMVKSIQDHATEEDITEQEAIVALKLISEETLTQLLAQAFHLEAINLEEVNFDEAAIATIPYDVCRKLVIIPVFFKEDKLVVAINDPSNITALETLKFYTDKALLFHVASKRNIVQTMQMMYSKKQSTTAVEALEKEFAIAPGQSQEMMDSERDEPTIKLTNSILAEAHLHHASDIHIEPYETYTMVRYRVDGKLMEITRLPIQAYPAVSTRLKLLGGMDISEKRLPQEGRIQMNFNDTSIDIRVSTLPNSFGEKIVMRLLERNNLSLELESLGLPAESRKGVESVLHSPHGLILITGPTGSGKSTTLYSFLNSIKSSEKAIVTVEDPVEYTIEGINQTPVNVKQGMTFPVALRSILRQDPDIIMIGEIRDEETASIAIRASITGHLVFSTLHTNDTLSAVSRMTDMNIEPYLIGDALRCVIAQRLLRHICPYCGEEYLSSLNEMRELDVQAPVPLVRAVGCKKCNHTGYKGRFAVYEIMMITGEVRRCIERGANATELRETVIKGGLSTLKYQAQRGVLLRKTTMEEFRGVAYEI